jgi:hypothetical protein
MLTARLFSLPQIYWAPITTLVITQSSLGTTLAVSWQRLIGTALGAAVGAIVASYFEPDMLVFGVGVFLLGIFCTGVRADLNAYRFGGVTLAIVLLVPRKELVLRGGWGIFYGLGNPQGAQGTLGFPYSPPRFSWVAAGTPSRSVPPTRPQFHPA